MVITLKKKTENAIYGLLRQYGQRARTTSKAGFGKDIHELNLSEVESLRAELETLRLA